MTRWLASPSRTPRHGRGTPARRRARGARQRTSGRSGPTTLLIVRAPTHRLMTSHDHAVQRMIMRMAKVGIVGASGYTGAELLRLCAGHPELEVAVATGESQAGTRAANLYPSVAAAYPDLVYSRYDRDDLHGL